MGSDTYSPCVTSGSALRCSRSSARRASSLPPPIPYPVTPEEHYGPPAGPRVVYGAPAAYFLPPALRPASTSSRPSLRTASSQSLRQQQSGSPSVPPYAYPYPSGRYYAGPEGHPARPPPDPSRAHPYPRPDPSDPNWEPRTRSASSLMTYPIDQYGYATYPQPIAVPPRFDPNDPRFASPPARRVSSGPPDMYVGQPSPIYREPPDELFLPGHTSHSAAMSPTIDDTDDSEDAGVQVEVREKPGGDYAVVESRGSGTSTPTPKKTVSRGRAGVAGGSGSRSGSGTAKRSGRRK